MPGAPPFTFRHYDAVVDDMQEVYNRIFAWSSFITPFFLGIIAGSAVSHQIDTEAPDFLSAFVFSWLSWFTVAIGFFTVAICGFLAAVYLIGEAESPPEKIRFRNKALVMNIAAVLSGGLVFLAAHRQDIPLWEWTFGEATGITAVLAATVSLMLLWYLMCQGRTKILRVLAAFQVSMILLAITFSHFPDIVILKQGTLSLMDHAGHEKTIDSLAMALLIGSVFILPALFYLIYSFQKNVVPPGKEI